MPRRGWFDFVGRWFVVQCLVVVIGCESVPRDRTYPPAAERPARRLYEADSTQLAQADAGVPQPPAQVPTQPIGPAATQPADTIEEIHSQIADPTEVHEILERELALELARYRMTPKEKQQKKAEHERHSKEINKRIEEIHRPNQVQLSLTDAVRKALQNNYWIQMQSYYPAIETTRIVEAEAQFDAVYFANFTNNKQDKPSSSQLQGTFLQMRNFESGVRKLLSAGTQVQVSYALNRTETDLVFVTMNPSYFNQFIVEFRQPFLKGFGLDFNRAQIEIAKLDREISIERLRREIRDTIYNTEQAYWHLLQTRRLITITARLLSNFHAILHSLEQRFQTKYDVYSVLLDLTKSRIEQREADFIQLRNEVMTAEDTLKNLLNDPVLNLSKDVEIIPIDVPAIEPLVVDQLGEITTALMHRSELHEAKLAIEQAQLAVGVAKNQALPRLDVMFRYIIDGLGNNADRAFSQLSENDFQEYMIGIEFEWPIGNRGPEAALRRARLQQAQAIAGHRTQIEQAILEVNQAIRELKSNYEQIGPRFRAAKASQNQVRATKARQERRDPPNLQVELDAHEALASARQHLLDVLVNYNLALINLERQKGTLLRYYNVVIQGVDDESYLKPYQPLGP